MARTPAVGADRWYELVHSDNPAVAEAACEGVARLAVFSGDFAIADPLLDLDRPAAKHAAFFAADVLEAKPALERLRAKLLADPGEEPWDALAVLERLGDTSTRAALPPEPVPHDALDDALGRIPQSFLDRSAAGELRNLLLLHLAAGESLVPESLVDALRRRDVKAFLDLLSATLPTDVERAAPWLRATAAARLATAREAVQRLSSGRLKKRELDAAGVVALASAVGARARVDGGPRAALALAFLEGVDVTAICRAPGDDPSELLAALANADAGAADDAVMSATLGWKVAKLAPQVADLAARGTFLWSLARSARAATIDSALVAAIDALEPARGTLGILCHLASADAATQAAVLLSQLDLTHSPALPFVVRSFPTPTILGAARKVAAMDREDLQDRLEFLGNLDPTVPALDPDVPALHCLACGHAWDGTGTTAVWHADDKWPDPPVPCPNCGVLGDAVLHGPAAGRSPMVLPYLARTPRRALEHLPAEVPAVHLAELADLAGDRDAADRALQLADPSQRRTQAPVMLRILRRRGDPRAIQRFAHETLLSVEGRFLDDADEDELRAALKESSAALHEDPPEVPEFPRDSAPEPAALRPPPEPARAGPKIGRNDACPCGSGKKYKKCHGA